MDIKKSTKYKLISIIIIITSVIIDQILKMVATTYLKPIGYSNFIDGIIHFRWLTNDGAAWGFFSGSKIMLIFLPSILIIVVLFLIFSGKFKDNFIVVNAAVIISGGIGNLIDRFFNGSVLFEGVVVDYLEFSFIDFPVFNFADICVSVGATILCIYILFFQEKRMKKINATENSKDIFADDSFVDGEDDVINVNKTLSNNGEVNE